MRVVPVWRVGDVVTVATRVRGRAARYECLGPKVRKGTVIQVTPRLIVLDYGRYRESFTPSELAERIQAAGE